MYKVLTKQTEQTNITKNNQKTIKKVLNNVVLTLSEAYATTPIEDLETLLEIQKNDSDALQNISPPLYKRFINKGNLDPIVNKGDKVRIDKFYSGNDDKEYIVEKVFIKNLTNMSVIIAYLEGVKDAYLTYYLYKPTK